MFKTFDNPNIESLVQDKEDQLFDRKGSRIDRIGLVDIIVGFANADGGVVVVGIEKDRQVTGIENPEIRIAEIVKATKTGINPSLQIKVKSLPCTNFQGSTSSILLIEIPQGTEVYSNAKDEAFLRIGDENIKLTFDQRLHLLDDRGKASFELQEAIGATIDDLDNNLLEKYKETVGLVETDTKDILVGRDLAKDKEGKLSLNMAGILLFGQKPERWVERARIRFLRYEGTTEKPGKEYNVTKDTSLYGPLPKQLQQIYDLLGNTLREFTVLDNSGRFMTQPEYPEFAWKEILINAVVHRSYLMRGADIQVKMFDNHLDVISPGLFPGPVNEKNIEETHYSRNPRIARVMSELGYVREIGEGINRVIKEVHIAKLPSPIFLERANAEVCVQLKNDIEKRGLRKDKKELTSNIDSELLQTLTDAEGKIVIFLYEYGRITTKEAKELLAKSRMTAIRGLKNLKKKGIIEMVGTGNKTYYSLKIEPKTKRVLSTNANKQESLF